MEMAPPQPVLPVTVGDGGIVPVEGRTAHFQQAGGAGTDGAAVGRAEIVGKFGILDNQVDAAGVVGISAFAVLVVGNLDGAAAVVALVAGEGASLYGYGVDAVAFAAGVDGTAEGRGLVLGKTAVVKTDILSSFHIDGTSAGRAVLPEEAIVFEFDFHAVVNPHGGAGTV